MLHFAPEKSIYDLLNSNPLIEYYCCDINPDSYKFARYIRKECGMNLTFKNNMFDIIIHNHILEHVPNDHEFLVECLRCLKTDGKIIATFPVSDNVPCYFNDKITNPKERLEVFGQEDHVRLYGYDFAEKLSDERYNLKIIQEDDILNKTQREEMNAWVGKGCIIVKK